MDNIPANKIPDDNRGRYRFKMHVAFENENGLWGFQSSSYLGVINIQTMVCLVLSLRANLFVECNDILINLWAVLSVSLALQSSTNPSTYRQSDGYGYESKSVANYVTRSITRTYYGLNIGVSWRYTHKGCIIATYGDGQYAYDYIHNFILWKGWTIHCDNEVLW